MKKEHIRILIACEESQTITKAFRELGFIAFSCDLKPCSGGYEEWHLQGDALRYADNDLWDLIIAHPPCTFLSASGARWLHDPRYPNRLQDREEAAEFFMKFVNLRCRHIAIENPVGYMSTRYKKPTQIIQPYQFGEPYRKTTCLWLKGLPKLEPTNIVDCGEIQTTKSGKRVPKWYTDALKAKTPEERRTIRSKTFVGIAKAMAKQWGDYLLSL